VNHASWLTLREVVFRQLINKLRLQFAAHLCSGAAGLGRRLAVVAVGVFAAFAGTDRAYLLARPEKHLESLNTYRKDTGGSQTKGRAFTVQENAFAHFLDLLFKQTRRGAFLASHRTGVTRFNKLIQVIHLSHFLFKSCKIMPASAGFRLGERGFSGGEIKGLFKTE
jgi:hypothetical protein